MPDDKRPAREWFEDKTGDIPSGPLGSVGGGDIIGAAGFVAVESSRPIIDLVPGVKQPGYKIMAHSTRRVEEGEEHVLDVAAISENVARWAAQYSSSPSNVNFLVSEKEVLSVEEITERRGYSTFRIVVLLKDPGEVDDDFVERDRWRPR